MTNYSNVIIVSCSKQYLRYSENIMPIMIFLLPAYREPIEDFICFELYAANTKRIISTLDSRL